MSDDNESLLSCSHYVYKTDFLAPSPQYLSAYNPGLCHFRVWNDRNERFWSFCISHDDDDDDDDDYNDNEIGSI